MFRIIGADGRQYGPVTADQVREWIAAGRANGQSLVQAEGTSDWKPLATFPEFAEALAKPPPAVLPSAGPPAGPAPGVPPSAPPNPQALADEILQRGYAIDIGSCLSRGWDKMAGDFWPIVGISTLVWLVLGAANSAGVGLFLNGALLGGLYLYYLKLIRGEKAVLADAFGGFGPAFLQLMVAAIVSGLLTALGLLLCIIPGIFFGVAWCLSIPLVIDKKLSFWDAMEVSRKVVTRHWWAFFGLLFLTILLNFLGSLLCCVGWLITATFTGLALMYAYEDIFGKTGAAGTAADHPLAVRPG